jgi:hypothetical protein
MRIRDDMSVAGSHGAEISIGSWRSWPARVTSGSRPAIWGSLHGGWDPGPQPRPGRGSCQGPRSAVPGADDGPLAWFALVGQAAKDVAEVRVSSTVDSTVADISEDGLVCALLQTERQLDHRGNLRGVCPTCRFACKTGSP